MRSTAIILSFLFLATFMASGQTPTWLPVNGLAAYYPFDGTADDLSGNANTGTPNSVTYENGHNGSVASSVVFSGSPSRINVPSDTSLDLNESLTIAVWVKLDPGTISSNLGKFFGEAMARVVTVLTAFAFGIIIIVSVGILVLILIPAPHPSLMPIGITFWLVLMHQPALRKYSSMAL